MNSYDIFLGQSESTHRQCQAAIALLKGKPIGDVILSAVEIWERLYGLDSEDINHGCCDDFAGDISRTVEGAEPVWDDELGGQGDHCLIVYRGRFYDSETPDGVDDFRELPHYNR